MRAFTLVLRTFVVCLLDLASWPSHAQITRDVVDGQTVQVDISQHQTTRIKFAHGHIREVTGNIYDQSANQAGDLVLKKDEVTGQIYVKPANPKDTKPINLFISTEHGTYSIILQPRDIPLDTILFTEPRAKQQTARLPKVNGYERMVKQLMVSMANKIQPAGYEVQVAQLEVGLFAETRFRLVRRYVGAEFIAEVYELTNVSDAEIVFTETELYKKNVVGIAFDHVVLEPSDSTLVYLVKENNGNE